MTMMKAARSLSLGVLLVTASARLHAGGVELHVQCPPGTGAAIEGDTVVCKPLPTTQPPQQGTKVIRAPEVLYPDARPAPAPAPAPVDTSHEDALELKGLRAIPEVCGLNTLSDDVVEQVAEAIHISMAECSVEVGADPPLRPTRWTVFRITALSETTHEVVSPRGEPWAASLDACLARHPPRFPKAVRGKSFTAWFLMAQTRRDRPPGPACVIR